MISYEQAAEIVAKELGPKWDTGTFYVEPKGYENSELFMVPYGAREFFVDEQTEFVVQDSPVALVNKTTGELTLEPYLDIRDLVLSLDEM